MRSDETDLRRTRQAPARCAPLARVRDKSENGMAIVASVRALEQLEGESAERGGPGATGPGLTIQIISAAPQPAAPVTIDARPTIHAPYVTLPEPEPEPRREPIFKIKP